MFVLSAHVIWDCFKKLMPWQASTAVKYKKESGNRIQVSMKDGTIAYFEMKDDHTYIYEKKF